MLIFLRLALGSVRSKNLSLLYPDWLGELLSFLSVDTIPFSVTSVVDKSTLVPDTCSGTFRSYMNVFRAAASIIQLRCSPSYNTSVYHYLYFIFILIHTSAISCNKSDLCNVQIHFLAILNQSCVSSTNAQLICFKILKSILKYAINSPICFGLIKSSSGSSQSVLC
jgi:hypothetical protein